MDKKIAGYLTIGRKIAKHIFSDTQPDEELLEWLSEKEDRYSLLREFSDLGQLCRMYEERERYRDEKEWQVYQRALRRKKARRTAVRISLAATLLITVTLTFWMHSAREEVPEQTLTVFTGECYAPGKTGAVIHIDGRSLPLSAEELVATEEGIIVLGSEEEPVYSTAVGSRQEEAPRQVVIEVDHGQTFSFVLSDGSRVWLNSGSRLDFPEFFTGRQRETRLSGEGYFEVAADPNASFIVRLSDLTVRVSGTEFNARNYPDEPHTSVSLFTGSVSVEDEQGGVLGCLAPDQQLSRHDRTGTVRVSGFNARAVGAWKNNVFYFERENLSAIARTLGRWYNVEFRLDPRLSEMTFTGSLSRHTHLSTVLHALQRTNQLEFQQHPEGYVNIIPAP